jgi:hypothetical protein
MLQEAEEKQPAESSYTQKLLDQLASAELKLQQNAESMTQLRALHQESIAHLRCFLAWLAGLPGLHLSHTMTQEPRSTLEDAFVLP